jgi:exosortase
MKLWWAYFCPLVVAYGVSLVWVWDNWMLPDSYYSHGPLVPVVALLVLWLRRDEWRATPVRTDGRAWWLLGTGLFMHLCGAALMVDSLSAASMALSLPGVVWLALGTARLRALGPILGLIVFALPMSMLMTGRIAFELKEVAIDLAVVLTDLLGIETERRGANLYVAPHTEPLEVADACSGLRSLIALTTLGYCVAFFMGPQRGPRRWVLLAASVPIAVLTNVVRIASICALARFESVDYAATTGHEITRWIAWVVALGLLLGLDWVLSSRQEGAKS